MNTTALNNCSVSVKGCSFYCSGSNNSSICGLLHTKWPLTTKQRWALSCHRNWKYKIILQCHGVTGTKKSYAICVQMATPSHQSFRSLYWHIGTCPQCFKQMNYLHTGLRVIIYLNKSSILILQQLKKAFVFNKLLFPCNIFITHQSE